MGKLSTRAHNALRYCHAFDVYGRVIDQPSKDYTPEEIANFTEVELLRIPNLGKVTLVEIIKWLRANGYWLDRHIDIVDGRKKVKVIPPKVRTVNYYDCGKHHHKTRERAEFCAKRQARKLARSI